MQIFVKFQDGKTLTFDVEPDDTIMAVKIKIEEIEGIPTSRMKLIYHGMFQYQYSYILEDSRTLSYYNINGDSEIHVLLVSEVWIKTFDCCFKDGFNSRFSCNVALFHSSFGKILHLS